MPGEQLELLVRGGGRRLYAVPSGTGVQARWMAGAAMSGECLRGQYALGYLGYQPVPIGAPCNGVQGQASQERENASRKEVAGTRQGHHGWHGEFVIGTGPRVALCHSLVHMHGTHAVTTSTRSAVAWQSPLMRCLIALTPGAQRERARWSRWLYRCHGPASAARFDKARGGPRAWPGSRSCPPADRTGGPRRTRCPSAR